MRTEKVSVILLRNEVGQILLQHRTEDAPTYPNHWVFFGGHIEEGETPEQAVKRETMEELKYRLRDPRLVKVHIAIYPHTNIEIYVFTEKYDGSELVLGEGQGMGWFSLAQTNTLLMNDHDRTIIQEEMRYT